MPVWRRSARPAESSAVAPGRILPRVRSAAEDRARVENLLAIALFAASAFVRPTIAGDAMSFVGSIALFAIGLASLGTLGFGGSLLNCEAASQGTAIVLWLFLMIHAALNGVPNFYAASAFLQISSCSVGAALCLSHRNVHDAFFSLWRRFLIALSISWIVTVALSLFVGLPSLRLASLQTLHYDVYEIYFPLTFSYGVKDYDGIQLVRASAWFREAGIAQAFYASAILTIRELKTARQWASAALLFVGGMATQSTIGIAVVGVSAAVCMIRIFRHPAIRLAILVPAAYLALAGIQLTINDDTIGLAAKMETDSYLDRATQVENGLRAFYENPLGYGAYNTLVASGVNLVSSLGSIGLFGAALVLLNIAASIVSTESKVEKFVFVLPLFVTSLTSQPLLDAALMYVFLGYGGARRTETPLWRISPPPVFSPRARKRSARP